jgi:hypothetical protein
MQPVDPVASGRSVAAVAFCPHPPVLVPALAGSAATEVADLLAAADQVVARLVAMASSVVVVGGGPRTARYPTTAPGLLGEFGGLAADGLARKDYAEDGELPLSLAVGRWLLERAHPDLTAVSLLGLSERAAASPALAIEGEVGLLVMGDGSARRGLKAPGYLDDRAVGFDDAVRRALGTGDAAGLAGLDAVAAADLLVAGAASWRAVGAALAGSTWSAELTYDSDPFGVQYFVAYWRPGDAATFAQ